MSKKLLRVVGKKAGLSEYDWEGEVDFSEPDQVEQYLKENMAEGYLANEENAFVEKLVTIYSELLSSQSDFESLIEQLQSNKVN